MTDYCSTKTENKNMELINDNNMNIKGGRIQLLVSRHTWLFISYIIVSSKDIYGFAKTAQYIDKMIDWLLLNTQKYFSYIHD